MTDKKTTKGYIYILYNPVYEHYGKNVYKIGKSKDVKSRINGYTTSYVDPSICKYISEEVENDNLCECIIFDFINEYRLVDNREFFQAPLNILKKNIDKVVYLINTARDYVINTKKSICCRDCGKIFTFRSGLSRHKKKYCKAKDGSSIIATKKTLCCNDCGKIFTFRSGLSRHKKKYCKANGSIIAITKLMQCLGSSYHKTNYHKLTKNNSNIVTRQELMWALVGMLYSGIEILKIENVKLKEYIFSKNNISKFDNDRTNMVGIKINSFGHENISYLTAEDKKDIIKRKHESLVRLIELIHFNPDHPENHNIFINSLHPHLVEVFKGGRWKNMFIENLLKDLVNSTRKKLELIISESDEEMIINNGKQILEFFIAIDGKDSEISENIVCNMNNLIIQSAHSSYKHVNKTKMRRDKMLDDKIKRLIQQK